MTKQNQFISPNVVGALCPNCGATYREDFLESGCEALNAFDGPAMSQCPYWTVGEDPLRLPCWDCARSALHRNEGTRKTILGLVDAGNGRLEFKEMHRCDNCSSYFQYPFNFSCTVHFV